MRARNDGGIDAKTARRWWRAGATRLVAGNAVFRDGPDGYAKNIEAIRAAAMGARGEIV